MASTAFDSFVFDALSGQIDMDTDTFKVMLVTSAYVEDKAAHSKRSHITNEIAAGGGYTAGGQAIVPTIIKDTVNHKTVITFPSVTWPNSTITARKAVYYKSRGGVSSADELVAVDDFVTNVVTTNTLFTLSPSVINVNTPA